MESANAPYIKKAKKKQVKDELDRIKQAEKKRRRLEKALATSAAIRAELEKKKQKKKEEQERLDDEGAAIAEAVALHVLLGEDSDETSRRIVLKENDGFDEWHRATHIGLFIDRPIVSAQNLKTCSFESMGHFLPNSCGPNIEWNRFGGGSNYTSSSSFPFLGDGTWGPSYITAELIAAQAVSSLKIGEDVKVDTGFYNRY